MQPALKSTPSEDSFTSMASTETALLLLAGSLAGSDSGLRSALQLTSKRLYVYFTELNPQVDVALLNVLSRAFDIAAVVAPVLDVVPLLSAAGWTAGKVAALENVQAVLVSSGADAGSSQQAAERLLALRPAGTVEPVVRIVQASQQATGGDNVSSVEIQGVAKALPVPKAAVGGTFDRLHAGHRMLLAVAALAASERVYVGVTGEQLLAKKQYRELLQSYEVREAAARSYLQAVRPGLAVATGALLDPKARTEAAADPGMEALVLSAETLSGGEAINEDRRAQGFPPLALLVVSLLGHGSRQLGGEKLSSTALRARDAAQGS